MDMVNDDKDIRLDTAEEVKKALLSGADLYNTETGEFWWLYNATDSIATATIHLTTRTCWRSSIIPISTCMRTSWAG